MSLNIQELKKICHAQTEGESWYIRTVVRGMSIYLTRIFLLTPLSANQISVIVMICGATSGLFLAAGGYLFRAMGAFLLQLFFVLDCVDGEVARYRKTTSLKGVYLDYVTNDILYVAMFLGLGFGLILRKDLLLETLPISKVFIAGCAVSCAIFPLLNTLSSFYMSRAGALDSDISKPVIRNRQAKMFKRALIFFDEPFHVLNIVTLSIVLNIPSLVLMCYALFFPLWWLAWTIARFRKT